MAIETIITCDECGTRVNENGSNVSYTTVKITMEKIGFPYGGDIINKLYCDLHGKEKFEEIKRMLY